MNSKTIFLTLFLFLGLTFQNCSDDSACDCCFAPAPDFFDIQNMDLFHSDTKNNLLERDTISFEDYGYFNVLFEVEFISYEAPPKWEFSFMNSAYGCTPPIPGQQGSKTEALKNSISLQ